MTGEMAVARRQAGGELFEAQCSKAPLSCEEFECTRRKTPGLINTFIDSLEQIVRLLARHAGK
jgi:hypothetical protein